MESGLTPTTCVPPILAWSIPDLYSTLDSDSLDSLDLLPLGAIVQESQNYCDRRVLASSLSPRGEDGTPASSSFSAWMDDAP